MKKLLVLMALCVFMVTPALADEPLYGTADILCVTVNQDVANGEPIASDVLISFTTCTPQGPYVLNATALGELLGGALWDSQTDGLPVNLGLLFTFVPPGGFSLVIDKAQTSGAGCDLCPAP